MITILKDMLAAFLIRCRREPEEQWDHVLQDGQWVFRG